MTGSRRRPPLLAARVLAVQTVLALLTVGLEGCVRLPESGPVVESSVRGSSAAVPEIYINPPPPRSGESAPDIVRHFLDAMTATPVQTSVARQFLSRAAQATWNPQQQTITYTEASQPSGAGLVEVRIAGAHHLDARGAWQGPLPGRQQTLQFPMTVENGQYRIQRAPDALIVPEYWFHQRFRQVSVYFFDPTARILVPEPVFVPRGDQLATSLVRGLLEGPGAGPGVSGISRSFVPPDTTLELSVAVSGAGVATVALQGDPGDLAPEAVPLLLAQLAWTLRQDPTIEALRVTIGGEPVVPAGDAEIDVATGAEFDPTGVTASSQMFGLRDGLVVVASPVEETLSGPMGRTRYQLREISVDLDATRVAGVTADGGRVLVAALREPVERVREVVSGGRSLLKPAWDFTGRLWLVDRTSRGAGVAFLAGGRVRVVDVPGVSGARVRAFLVSRDASRLVVVVSQRGGDVLKVARLRHDNEGRVIGATPARRVAEGSPGDPLRVRAVGWRSPTSIAVVAQLSEIRDEVRVVSVDGSPVAGDDPGTSRRMLNERVRRLVASPVADEVPFVVTRSGLQDPFEPDRTSDVDPSIRALTYVG